MQDKNLTQRLLIIGAVIVAALLLLRDPRQTLRPGLDIAGGTSLIFEIDTTPQDPPDLAEKVKELLQRRVDPKGVYDLTWRVQGRNRLEVQMPLAPKDAKQRLETYRVAFDALFEPQSTDNASPALHEITRGALERVLQLTGTARADEIERLARRNSDDALAHAKGDATLKAALDPATSERRALLTALAERYDALQAATAQLNEITASAPADSQPAVPPDVQLRQRTALEEYEDAVDGVLATNLSRRRFQEILDLDADSKVRQDSLADLRQRHPDLAYLIDDVVTAHAAWRQNKQFLDGPADLKRLLRGSGRLEFRILAASDSENPTKYDTYRRQLTLEGVPRRPGDPYGWFKIDNPMQFFNLDTQAQLDEFRKTYKEARRTHFVVEMLGDDYFVLGEMSPSQGLLHAGQRNWKLDRALMDRDREGSWCVRFRLNPVGGSLFKDLTTRNIGRPLCILVDDVAYSAPNINSAIGRDGEITGNFSLDKVTYLVRTMEGGTLPARLKETPLSERTIGSSLGEANRDQAIRAGWIGAAVVAFIMIGYYRLTCGLIALFAFALNVVLILAVMALLHARISLVGIAGIVLSIGMAVDANVLIFERMRDEKSRGTSLRMIVRNGYDKVMAVIIDSNLTTLLTSVIIYYVGSEEVKGFGLTLGWGVALNLFTAIFVTRTIFVVLLKYEIIKDFKFMEFLKAPRIDWYAKRKFFLPFSLFLVVGGLALMFARGSKDFLDVEFLGGASAEFVTTAGTQLDDVSIKQHIDDVAGNIASDANKLANASIAGGPDVFTVSVPGVSADRLAALITEPLEEANLLERGGLHRVPNSDSVSLTVPAEIDQAKLTAFLTGLAQTDSAAAQSLTRATVNSVLDPGDPALRGRTWNLTTTVTNMQLVEHALTQALGDQMEIQASVTYTLAANPAAPSEPFPITDRLLESVVPGLPPGVTADLTDYLGGAAFDLSNLDPPQTVQAISTRLDNMLFQPDFQDQPKRPFTVIGIEPAASAPAPPAAAGQPGAAGSQTRYRRVVVATVDPELRYSDDPTRWASAVAAPEQRLIDTALSSEQALRKVMQFKPQIADRSARQAAIALLLGWVMIIAYVWIRFGSVTYGAAGVIALIHDVLIALAFVGFSGWIGGADHPIGRLLLIGDFKINMTIVAALLTIIGYSINDTIVIFDRIREIRGRLGVVTPEVINDSINQMLARTILLSTTVFGVVVVAYIWGGSSIRGFNYCMLVGVVVGMYTTCTIAAPLLLMFPGVRRASVRAT